MPCGPNHRGSASCIHCRAIGIPFHPSSEHAKRWLLHPGSAAFGSAFATFLAVALAIGAKPFYYDSHAYWALSHTFAQDGHFSLLNFENNGLRGYGLPLVFFAVRNLGEQLGFSNSHIAGGFNAALFALIGAVLTPALAQITWPGQRWSWERRLFLCALLLVFWRGYLSFPLSDFPALALALVSLVAVASIDSPYRMLTAGVTAGLAVNVRPAYLILVPALAALIAWEWIARSRSSGTFDRSRAALCSGIFLLGLGLAWAPQVISNHERLGSYSPIPGGTELADFQYTEGLRLQRFDTFVGNHGLTPRMLYEDPHTRDIVADLDGGLVDGTAGYVALVFEHPITMAGVFLRHGVNGLDQRYPTPYVENLDGGGSRVDRFLGFLLVFLALTRLAWPDARRRLGRAQWRYPAALLVAGASSMASAVEARFLLPVFILAAMVAIAPGSWPSPLGSTFSGARRVRVPAALLLGLAVYGLIVATIVSGASDHLTLTATR